MKAQVTSGEILEWCETNRRMLAIKVRVSPVHKSIRLHVRTNQEALLLNKGLVAARFLPGIYTLSANTESSYLIESGDGDVAFVKSNFLVLKKWEATYTMKTQWGTESIDISGTYDACIFEPAKFLKSLTAQKQFSIDDLKETIETIINDILPMVIEENQNAPSNNNITLGSYVEECLNLTLYPSGIIIKNFTMLQTDVPI